MRGLVRFRPVHPYQLFRDELNRFFEDSNTSPVQNCVGCGSMDVAMRDNEVVVSVDLPGVKKEDIQTRVDGNTLFIRATRQSNREEENTKYFIVEREHGEIQRAVQLPVEVDSKKAKAQFNDGVLTITMPKSERLLQQDIKID